MRRPFEIASVKEDGGTADGRSEMTARALHLHCVGQIDYELDHVFMTRISNMHAAAMRNSDGSISNTTSSSPRLMK